MGGYEEATSLLTTVRRRIESYAGDHPHPRRIVEELWVDFGEYLVPLSSMEPKGRY
jgi:hypothetical protein